MATVMKTPGVYVIEKDAFPSSVVEVATAVPAFIGYTEKALNKEQSLHLKPRRITSLADYEKYFGGAPELLFELKETELASASGSPETAEPAAEAESSPTPAEPYPARVEDAVVRRKKDGKVTHEYHLERVGQRYHLYHSMVAFFKNGGGACYVVSAGEYKDGEITAKQLSAGITSLVKEQEPTMVVIPDAVLLEASECYGLQQEATKHCAEMQSRVAILDVHQGFKARDEGADCVDAFRGKLGINYLDYATAYYPWIDTSIVAGSDLSYKNLNEGGRTVLKRLLESEVGNADTKKKAEQIALIQSIPLTDEAAPNASGAPAGESAETPTEGAAGEGAETQKPETPEDKEARERVLNKGLVALSPWFNDILKEAQNYVNRLPPSGAIAGVYTMVDNTRGVWKAPANVSLNAVVKPAVNVSHDEQEDLNVTTSGKSVNAIRSFVGEGTLVWGARTLDGNSFDWRYINVRRTLIMLEQSIKSASKAYVFEPNDANTWITIKSMVRNFLTGIWKRGGLAGASPDEAFSVHVGLGETMTPEDILEGILRVTVLVAPTRPAEFIELTFQQKMQES